MQTPPVIAVCFVNMEMNSHIYVYIIRDVFLKIDL